MFPLDLLKKPNGTENVASLGFLAAGDGYENWLFGYLGWK